MDNAGAPAITPGGAPPPALHDAQRVAAAAVRRVLAGRNLSQALAEVRSASDRPLDRSLVQELAYGTLRHLGHLRAQVGVMAERTPDPTVEALLWVALYQLGHGRIPAFTVVDQAVRACRVLAQHPASGFVNGVLRRYLRERSGIDLLADATDEGRWSYPAWWVARVRADHPGAADAVLAAGNERPPLTLRVNPRAGSVEALVSAFAAAGIPARPVGAVGLTVESPRPVTELPGFAQGAFSVQDLGAQYAAPLLDPAGRRVLDACAAPGGKTTHLVELGASEVVAIDTDTARLERVRENLARLQLDADVRPGDALRPDGWWNGRLFERILLDAPCSASGVVRRHPDGKWLRRESDIASLAATQAAMLDALWPLLARGGLLLYATCSLFHTENEAQVTAFLSRHPDAVREALHLPGAVAENGGQLLPASPAAAHNHDGFFYALLGKA